MCLEMELSFLSSCPLNDFHLLSARDYNHVNVLHAPIHVHQYSIHTKKPDAQRTRARVELKED